MKVVRIDIENILGHERLTIEPDAVTVIEGRNATGKTSALEAIRAALRGGEDPTLLRVGADKGSVKLLLEDKTEILRRWSRKGPEVRSTLDVRLPLGGKVSTPRKVIDSLVDELCIDPLTILSCPPAKRAEYLTDIMAVDIPEEELHAAAGRPVTLPRILGGSGLDRLAAYEDALFNERTGANRVAKEARATAARLRTTLPPDGERAADDLPELRAVRAEIQERKAEAEKAAARDREDAEKAASRLREHAVKSIRSNEAAEIESIREDADRRIRAIEKEREEALDRVRSRAAEQIETRSAEERKALDAATDKEREALAEIRATYDATLAEQDAVITRAEAAAEEYARSEKTREIIADAEREADRQEADSEELTKALGRLAALKSSVLERLPVRGLEIHDRQVFIDGVPFDRANRARQIEVALKVAKLRAGKLGLIVVDNAEALDHETFKSFERAAAATGLQFVVGRVTDGDFSVRTSPATGAAA